MGWMNPMFQRNIRRAPYVSPRARSVLHKKSNSRVRCQLIESLPYQYWIRATNRDVWMSWPLSSVTWRFSRRSNIQQFIIYSSLGYLGNLGKTIAKLIISGNIRRIISTNEIIHNWKNDTKGNVFVENWVWHRSLNVSATVNFEFFPPNEINSLNSRSEKQSIPSENWEDPVQNFSACKAF